MNEFEREYLELLITMSFCKRSVLENAPSSANALAFQYYENKIRKF